MPRPTHFEIPAEDPARAIAFYETVFGWKFTPWGDPSMPYWLVSTGTGPGIDGGLMPQRKPGQPCVNSLTVDDLDAILTSVAAHGGVCVAPKMPIPGVGWLAYCKDTEGHLFGIMQNDPAAK